MIKNLAVAFVIGSPLLIIVVLGFLELLHHKLLASFVFGLVVAEAGMYAYEMKKNWDPSCI